MMNFSWSKPLVAYYSSPKTKVVTLYLCYWKKQSLKGYLAQNNTSKIAGIVGEIRDFKVPDSKGQMVLEKAIGFSMRLKYLSNFIQIFRINRRPGAFI